jgi:DedD protein
MGLFSFPGKSQQDADDDLDVPVKPRRSRRSPTQDEEPIDPMLPDKQRARRRLIGATALVLAAIIGLPMIFDSEPKPLADDIAIQIPSRDKPGAAPNSPSAMAPLPVPLVEPKKALIAPPTSSWTEPKVESKAEAKTESAPTAVANDKTSAAENVKPSGEKAAQKSTERASAEKAPSSRFILQVAAVATKTKADELQAKLKQAGIKSYSQKISTKDGERYRIRVGPYGSRDEADKMRTRLIKMGLSVAVQSV